MIQPFDEPPIIEPIPEHWIGIRADWLETCQSIGEALVSLPPAELDTHGYVIGRTGSGKTNGLHHLIAQDLRFGRSVVVLDARGDLVEAALGIGASCGVPPHAIALIDLRERDRPQGFNPLAGEGEPYFRALGVLDAVAAESDSWGVQIAETLRNAVLLLAETDSALTDLEALFTDPEFLAETLRRSHSPGVQEFWQRYAQLSCDRQASLATPVLNKVSILFATRSLRRMFGHQEPLDLGRHLSRRGSVTLVSLAVDELHSAGWMTGSILLASICREVFARVGIPEAQRNPVRLYVDEFENFGTRYFEQILAEGRRFKLSTVVAHQTLAQLSPKMRAILLGNVGVKLVFACGRQDADALNRDLTGDPKAFDLAELPTGYAVLWRRGYTPLPIELNAPLFGPRNLMSPRAERLRAQVRDLVPPFQPRLPAQPISIREPQPDQHPDQQPNHKPDQPAKSLEDWLCE